MLRTILRRVVQMIVVLVVVTFFTSILTSLLPGDPVTTIAPFANAQQHEQIRKANHLDDNIVVR
ncbi:MAG TPA: ABC transporter permease, partial [Acidimicrobiia bacterium]|nr:ABC transporter permease [Acidimicrobiia bacterium]